ncbi:MAG TPA: hypothetical protein VK927_08140 [Adhaeribacter sp.]|nr:hypothetical protein [Adhaeribacter sp.]
MQQFYNNHNQVFLQLNYDADNNWVYANWIGYISEASVITGTDALLEMLAKTKCPYLLNDNRQLNGPWDKSNHYVEEEVIPRAIAFGLRHMAHILAPAVSGALSAQDLQRRTCGLLEMKLFGDMEKARKWLYSCQEQNHLKTKN